MESLNARLKALRVAAEQRCAPKHTKRGGPNALGWEIADDVREVAAPERLDALLGCDTREAVHDARVASNLARADLGVRVLRLDDELDALDGGSHRLGDSERTRYRATIRSCGIIE